MGMGERSFRKREHLVDDRPQLASGEERHHVAREGLRHQHFLFELA